MLIWRKAAKTRLQCNPSTLHACYLRMIRSAKTRFAFFFASIIKPFQELFAFYAMIAFAFDKSHAK